MDTVKYKICKSYFVTFQHSFLQLKGTWSSVSPQLDSVVEEFLVLLFQPAICRADNVLPVKTAPPHGGSGTHLIHGSLGPPQSSCFCRAHNCDI